MFLKVVAFPESGRILGRHLVAAACLGISPAVVAFLPFLARERFAANNWQTTVITAAIPVMQLFSIFWNHYYVRVGTGRYLLAVALLHSVPVGLIGAVRGVEASMVLWVLAAFGNAGIPPLTGDLLRSCYAPLVRGRVFGVVSTAAMLSTLATGLIVGALSDRDPDAFRLYLPGLALIHLTGLLLVWRISRELLFQERMKPAPTGHSAWWEPLRQMARTLKEDPRFAAYEVAFMSYGVGWMICTALLPALATDRLRLSYSQYSLATIVIFQVVMILLLAPVGHLTDRVGAMRVARYSFLWLTIYPLGLLLARGFDGLALFSLLYAVGMVGVNLTWTLGPIALSPDPSRTSHYLAIHTTMVGVRGLLAQGLGMALYVATGSFTVPLVAASLGFLWAGVRMRSLDVVGGSRGASSG